MARKATFVLNGPRLRDRVPSNFDAAAAVTGAELLRRADCFVSDYLWTSPVPSALRSTALKRMGVEDEVIFLCSDLEPDDASQTLDMYLTAIADSLNDDPIDVVAFDGKPIMTLLEDENLLPAAESLFNNLDINNQGMIAKSEISYALAIWGDEMGVPLPTDFPQLESILTRNLAYQQEELDSATFTVFLRTVLQELADALANNPIVLLQNVMVSSKLSKESELIDRGERFPAVLIFGALLIFVLGMKKFGYF